MMATYSPRSVSNEIAGLMTSRPSERSSKELKASTLLKEISKVEKLCRRPFSCQTVNLTDAPATSAK